MTPASVERAGGRAVAPLVLTAGCALLMLRPDLRGVDAATAVLAVTYALVLVASATAPLPGAPQDAAPAMRPVAVLAAGVGAVVLASAVGGSRIATPVSAWAPGLNVLAAVAEEALFRRLAYGWLLRLGPAVAVLASATLFALVHIPVYGPAAIPVDLGAGLLLSWQRSASGTWTVPAATHAAANLLAMLR
jgi:membrane protease YdiL (CAAX protease family)